ncbi:hypothetical protein Dimus_026948 [Dionaea muscipula]
MTIDSLMSQRVIIEAAAETIGGTSGEGSRRNATGVASNNSEFRDSSTQNASSSQIRILDLNVSQTKGQKKGKQIVSESGRMKGGRRNRDIMASSSV